MKESREKSVSLEVIYLLLATTCHYLPLLTIICHHYNFTRATYLWEGKFLGYTLATLTLQGTALTTRTLQSTALTTLTLQGTALATLTLQGTALTTLTLTTDTCYLEVEEKILVHLDAHRAVRNGRYDLHFGKAGIWVGCMDVTTCTLEKGGNMGRMYGRYGLRFGKAGIWVGCMDVTTCSLEKGGNMGRAKQWHALPAK